MSMPSRNVRGFTLFEMVLVVAIFILLTGGIFATVNAAIRATATLSEENIAAQRISAFVSLLRRTLHNLPATALISGGVQAAEGEGFAEIVLREAPGAFAWGLGGPTAGTAILSTRPRLGGGREFSIMLLPGSLTELERRDAVRDGRWLRLVPDVRSAAWRFYDPAREDWVEEWPEGTGRPPLVELTFELLGEDIPRRYVFWLPPVKEAVVLPPNPEGSPSPSPTPPAP